MLKVVRHHHNNIEEVYPINGIYKVYELDTYELEYSSDSPIVEQNVFLEDILLDYLKNHNNTEVVMTGRNAPDYLIDLADYVSEINPVKHPYKRGIKGRKGIEY